MWTSNKCTKKVAKTNDVARARAVTWRQDACAFNVPSKSWKTLTSSHTCEGIFDFTCLTSLLHRVFVIVSMSRHIQATRQQQDRLNCSRVRDLFTRATTAAATGATSSQQNRRLNHREDERYLSQQLGGSRVDCVDLAFRARFCEKLPSWTSLGATRQRP